MKGWHKFTEAQKADIVALYRGGLKLDAIAEMHQRERDAIRLVVKRSGAPRRPRSWSTQYIGPGLRSIYGAPV